MENRDGCEGMKNQNGMTIQLIAPCGMNCGTCVAYLRDKKACPGCFGDNANKSKTCVECIIKNCPELTASRSKYCGLCPGFPCKRLKQLDKRYRTKYGMSMIKNLAKIREIGIRSFVKEEKQRWACSTCGHTLCVHRNTCPQCGAPRQAGLNWKSSRAVVPNPAEILADIAKKDYNQARYVKEILVDDTLRDLLMEQMLSNPNIMVYYHCYEVVAAASQAKPRCFYPYWDQVKVLLKHRNSYHRDIGLTVLANLSKADDEDRINATIDEYLELLQDEKFMTACCCVDNSWKIILSKPPLAPRVLNALQQVEWNCRYPEKQKALLMSSILQVFDRVYDMVEEKTSLIAFAQRNLDSISPKTRKIAKQFLSKHP